MKVSLCAWYENGSLGLLYIHGKDMDDPQAHEEVDEAIVFLQ